MSSAPRKRKSESSASTPTKRKAKSTTTAASVSNFFKPSSQKEHEPTTWKLVSKTLLAGKYSPKPNEGVNASPPQATGKLKVAGFDLDSTLISTVSGNKFAKDAQDWKWWHTSVPSKLKSLHEQGCQIVIFTNQNGIPDPIKDSVRQMAFKVKLGAIFTSLGIPGILVYAATANDKYRKPRPGMWEELLDDLDLDVVSESKGIDLEGSYLVGDAAGREGDFSDTDRNWAMNLKIGFHTPEEFFLNEAPKPMSHRFNPSTYITSNTITTTTTVTTTTTTKQSFTPNTKIQEIILFCGSPGSGKSTFYRRNLKPLGYEHINQDTLKSKPKCLKVARERLSAGKSITVDNTNADLATRKLWVDLARETKVPIRCIHFTASVELCTHNAAVRAFGGAAVNPEGREMVPRIAFAGFKGRFVEPKVDEGLDEVYKVDFEWQGDEKERELWCKFWI